jgi:Tfp pilus assembly protein PilO
MRIATRDRLWLVGGLVAALLLTLLVWQLVIKNQQDKTNSVKDDVATAQQQVVDSTRQLNQLRADSANLAKYQATLAADQQALPTSDGVAAFLRELHDAGDAAGVAVVQLTVGKPTVVTGATVAGSPVYDLSLSLVVTGPLDALNAFLKQVQAEQPRAVLLKSVNESPGSTDGGASMNLTLDAFTTSASAVVATS